ncbi:competence damage-inducible protein A [Chryseobacterium taklimakanense]|uniref:Competence damage-inducible protein A n=1 Tax=Chryseobacterium taklimakanense TaxID=536441 RepID=A0A239WR14_9FLAO|nr:nicotinamide-nucleotide amidohydrolase family protein [Chryseobacterium taklimakanense]SNV36626.1 competence damage-inducible protein A [Chryseobacterium taklimakanense]
MAESCTAGLLQNVLSQAEESMSFFQGGMTVYNIGQKAKQLNVNPIFAVQNNAVSKDIAEKMALEIAQKFNAELGVAITGYAQPVPEENICSCFAYIAFSKNSKVILSKRILGDPQKSLSANQSVYVEKIIKELLNKRI